MTDSLNPGTSIQQVTAGTLAGVFSRVCTHPIDTIKTRLQARTYEVNNSTLLTAIRSEGWRGLYRGFYVSTLLSIPALSVYLTTYDNVKHSLFKRYPSLSEWKVHLVSGLSAEAISGVLWTPMEVIKQRLQIQINDNNAKYSSSLNAIKSVYYNEGIVGFFKGYGVQLGVFGPFSMLNFVIYEYLKSLKDKNNLTFSYLLSSSLIAASVSSIVTTPLDVIKTRIQIEEQKTHLLQLIKNIYQKEGFLGYTKGLTARLLWITPGTAIILSTYDQFKKIFIL